MASAGGRGQTVEGMAKRIKARREALGWSQEELARQMGGGEMQVSHYECERRTPSAAALKELAKALGCSADYLLGLKDRP
jgi:transcriptional regulator with XRE-family HTH domain